MRLNSFKQNYVESNQVSLFWRSILFVRKSILICRDEKNYLKRS